MCCCQTRHVENSVFAAIKGYQQENTTSSNSNEDNQIIDIFQEGVSESYHHIIVTAISSISVS